MSGIQCLTDRHIPPRRLFPNDAIGIWVVTGHCNLFWKGQRALALSHRKKRPFAGSSELARVVFLSYGLSSPRIDTGFQEYPVGNHHGAWGTLYLDKVNRQDCLFQNKLQCPVTWWYSRFGFLGRMTFIEDGLKTLKNGDFKATDDIRVSQKYNPQFPKNNSFSFLGSVFGRNQSVCRIFLT